MEESGVGVVREVVKTDACDIIKKTTFWKVVELLI